MRIIQQDNRYVVAAANSYLVPPFLWFRKSLIYILMTRGKFQTAEGIQMSQKEKKKRKKETGTIEPKALILIDILKQLRQIYSAVKLIT